MRQEISDLKQEIREPFHLQAVLRKTGWRGLVIVDTKSDLEILNASLGGEYFGIAAYDAAMGTGLLEPGVRDVAQNFQDDHRQHAQRIQEAIDGSGQIVKCVIEFFHGWLVTVAKTRKVGR